MSRVSFLSPVYAPGCRFFSSCLVAVIIIRGFLQTEPNRTRKERAALPCLPGDDQGTMNYRTLESTLYMYAFHPRRGSVADENAGEAPDRNACR